MSRLALPTEHTQRYTLYLYLYLYTSTYRYVNVYNPFNLFSLISRFIFLPLLGGVCLYIYF